jgi:hypothetical protein
MINRNVVVAALLCASAFFACKNSGHANDPVVKVGKATLGSEALEAFRYVARIYPAPLPYYFPGQRQPATFMAECEAVYQYAKPDSLRAAIESGLDWKWKERYFKASLFFNLLGDNLGFTDSELEAYYKKNAEAFRVEATAADGKDSSYVPPFSAAKRQAADRLFCDKYKPDSAFTAKLGDYDGGLDSAAVLNHWIYSVRSNPADFYMRRFFLERTGEAYADDIKQIYGEGKPIVSKDIDVARSWVPENRRNMRMEDLIEWLYKWTVFSEHADKAGLTSGAEYKNLIHWAMRVEYAASYLREKVLPNLPLPSEPTEPDISLAELVVFDQTGRADKPDRQQIISELNNIAKIRAAVAIDSAIYGIRKSAKIKWLNSEVRDERSSVPAALIARADSLKEIAADIDASQSDAEEAMKIADSLYRAIAADFAFAPEGKRAANELAKLLVDKYSSGSGQEKYLLFSAIHYYRRAQMLDTDRESLCNSYFMTGFTYDEHLKTPALAEANYKWILRNTPECSLASDAEFMILHLGEPMTSIEEIQGQSLRQGRKVDFDEMELGSDDAPETAGGDDSEDEFL